MFTYDPTTLNGVTAATISTAVVNPYSEIGISSSTTTCIGTDFIELAGKRFNSKQLAYLLSKLLEEHPECRV